MGEAVRMNTFVSYIERVQQETLNSIKQVQDLNLKTLATFTYLVSAVPTIDAKEASANNMPTPTEFVQRSFEFTNEILATRKEYMIKLAELATEAQKQFAETATRIAESAKN